MKNVSSAHKRPRRTAESEVCELLVAELEGRRERLRHLLRMVLREAERHSEAGTIAPLRTKCRGSAPASKAATAFEIPRLD